MGGKKEEGGRSGKGRGGGRRREGGEKREEWRGGRLGLGGQFDTFITQTTNLVFFALHFHIFICLSPSRLHSILLLP